VCCPAEEREPPAIEPDPAADSWRRPRGPGNHSRADCGLPFTIGILPANFQLSFLPAALLRLAVPGPNRAQVPGTRSGLGPGLCQIDFARSKRTSAADQICMRYAPGSTVSDPPLLQSQNGVLEVTMGFYTVTDSQGLVRYCYVTNTGLEAPTLIVNPGDNLIIHFQNDMLAPSATSASHNMASMKMTLSNDDGTTSTSSACDGKMGANVTNIHFTEPT
jgi:hypothetical protein